MLKRIVTLLSLMLACGAAGFVGGLVANLDRRMPPPEIGMVGVSLPETLRAKRFQVIGEGGRIAAELTPLGLDIFGQDGRVRATLQSAVLGFSDAKWEGRALFGILSADTQSDGADDWGLLIFDPDKRHPVVQLMTEARGKRGYLGLRSEKGERTVSAPD
jgi:hypothetical protein